MNGVLMHALVLIAAMAAGYCGPPADAYLVQNKTVAQFNSQAKASRKINSTYISAVVVLGTYAEADISAPAGLAPNYWIKKMGVWTFAGYFAPKGWPASVKAQLTKLSDQRANGSKQCTNPHFVPRGSG
jgi:hypothetical protein